MPEPRTVPMSLEEFWNDRVRAATGGDLGAFEHLLVHCHDGLLRQIRRGIPMDYERHFAAEDVLQDTFRAALVALPEFRGSSLGEFAAWTRTIARHQLADARDRARALKRGGGRAGAALPFANANGGENGSDPVAAQLVDYLASNSKSPRSAAGHREYLKLVGHALKELDTTQRNVLRLRFVEQEEHAAIGAQLGRTEDAVKMVCFRAIKKLRGMLPRVSE